MFNDPVEEFAYRQQGDRCWINHKHVNGNNYELIQVLNGSGNVLIGSHTRPMQDRTLLIIDSSFPHCVNPLEPDSYCRSKIIFSHKYLSDISELCGFPDLPDMLTGQTGGRCLYLDAEQNSMFDAQFQQMRDSLSDKSQIGNAGFFTCLMNMITAACRINEASPSVLTSQSVSDIRIDTVTHYICEHLAEPLTVETIADNLHFSKYHLCHLFHHETGLTIMNYLYAQRVSKALRLLTETDFSVSDIAQQCGFSSSSHLCTRFKEYAGTTPMQYRTFAAQKTHK